MTHRMLSRNASSSRAVPTAKLIEEVRSENRAAPVFWGKNQSGMQAVEELSDRAKSMAQYHWSRAAESAAAYAECLIHEGVHKQIVNRILEPFTHINVIATATEWKNFFGLRLHKDAQPEMKTLAVAMWEALGKSIPIPRDSSNWNWHLPFIGPDDFLAVYKLVSGGELPNPALSKYQDELTTLLIQVSVARCARVSYLSNDTGKLSNIDEDLILYKRLVGSQPLHASPAEHQAFPDNITNLNVEMYDGQPQEFVWDNKKEHGNFVGWRQYRKMLPNEAIADLPEGYR